MKEFQSFQTELNEGVEDLVEHATMPPNILILRRITVRQFPGDTMVALYKNDRLGLTFSIPYGAGINPVVTPLEEGFSQKKEQYHRWMGDFEKHVGEQEPRHVGKVDWDTAHYLHSKGHTPKDAARKYVNSKSDSLPDRHDPEGIKKNAWGNLHESDKTSQELESERQEKTKKLWDSRKKRWGEWKAKQKPLKEETIQEDVIDRLRHIKDFHAVNHVQHDDGTRTTVDPTTAHALLTVHDALHPDNREKFASHLEHSKPKFKKMLDFAWKNVK